MAFALRHAYARWLAADEATAALGVQYLNWFVPALPLQFILVAMGAALRGIGDVKMPTLIQIATVVLNIVVAPVLMFGWGTGRPLGVAGTALASVLAVAFGAQYLRIISWNFLASGLVFVSSSVFQGMGHTLPPLASSALRLVIFAVPAYALSRQPGFDIRHVWYLSLASVLVQVTLNLWLLRREFARRLDFAEAPAAERLVAIVNGCNEPSPQGNDVFQHSVRDGKGECLLVARDG